MTSASVAAEPPKQRFIDALWFVAEKKDPQQLTVDEIRVVYEYTHDYETRASVATEPVALNEEEMFKAWGLTRQGKAYRDVVDAARDAWMGRALLAAPTTVQPATLKANSDKDLQRIMQSEPAATVQPATDEQERLVKILRDIAQAYPEDVFGPVTDFERKTQSGLISRASGAMGRHLSQFMTQAADMIERGAVQPATHKGWRLVPIEPDDDMLLAGQEAWMKTHANRPAIEDCEQASVVYRAMLEATPTAAQPATLSDAEDAKRYRWLRNASDEDWTEVRETASGPQNLDFLIDDAILAAAAVGGEAKP